MALGDALQSALVVAGGVTGELSVALERRRPATKRTLLMWADRLRQAADRLEREVDNDR